ncbi:chemotaxis protein CheW [Planctomicrobium piriforme]|uniref:Purine-binding chemotaxis protein CheW n=1 Tax=Planctomicrobium piriforme TaxID=1576369 RepID=A0A1I3QKN0_9PLAN|nr:chemotaxis protein CheW [Planctomicrobium piriforme]SFJ33736.1 purine-binding chemotaxis protein CheW [Planctomicrobium piriforme]
MTAAELHTPWDDLRAQLSRIRENLDAKQSNSVALAERLQQRALAFRAPVAVPTSPGRETAVVTFTTGGEHFGIAARFVLQILPLDHYSPVPGAPSFIRGVVQYRGAILSVLDLHRLLNLPEQGLADLHQVLIVQAGGRQIAIAAGDVEDLRMIADDQIQSAPTMTDEFPSHWVLGICDTDRVLLRLDEILQDERLTAWRSASAGAR